MCISKRSKLKESNSRNRSVGKRDDGLRSYVDGRRVGTIVGLAESLFYTRNYALSQIEWSRNRESQGFNLGFVELSSRRASGTTAMEESQKTCFERSRRGGPWLCPWPAYPLARRTRRLGVEWPFRCGCCILPNHVPSVRFVADEC